MTPPTVATDAAPARPITIVSMALTTVGALMLPVLFSKMSTPGPVPPYREPTKG